MEKSERDEYSEDIGRGLKAAMSDPKYWARRRSKWDEWGSPVGLSLGWAIFVVSSALVIYLFHLSELL